MIHVLPELPWAQNALAHHISAETLEYHWGKHHRTYVDNLNKLIPGTKYESLSLEAIVKSSEGGIFNNSAQIWNHTFYWNGLRPGSASEPTGPLADAIAKKWGSFATFREEMSKAATTLFGSGWAWLVKKGDGSVEIVQTQNAGCPLTTGDTPLLTVDVWEHAYYVDYRNARAKYVEAMWNLMNWEFAAKNFGG
jgi:Fe-Mn family superoxide dismutase